MSVLCLVRVVMFLGSRTGKYLGGCKQKRKGQELGLSVLRLELETLKQKSSYNSLPQKNRTFGTLTEKSESD